ncbi:phosphoadenosine phosphosulfate reductase family protein [Pelagerythrobacter aerophilus]|uniref:3'-phosphoadenosine 5'-phosphosulfate sulfotransferase n=1 Tax=Pelagerythrobacter aerophilus TaxID=2306995 RepID=A0A418NJT1_9SPHN|nr:phosphoadenosine phosphosulfate reductase family protein [Pelagerythrobacter aerophilus]RIV79596.1 3'-phosphoadenosine 5'-phosphosulfate sulfotransferase [Pelagerythrobacter aerophilus]
MTNPYRIEGPALISFSGGRTSGYMLWHILDAHDGKLPDDVHVCFANTGKEREETLRFVHECATRWGVRVRWIEFVDYAKKAPVADRFEEVGFNSASRSGEPFAAVIRRKGYLPNSVTRFCTTHMKIETLKHFMLSLGYKTWTNVVGLRADEMHRVARGHARNASGKDRWKTVMPLADAGVTNRDVRAFWARQEFDLGLLPFEGNCDACFLKARPKLWEVERTRPGTLDWWSQQEAEITGKTNKASGARFVTEYSYAELIQDVRRQPDMFAGGLFDDDPDMDAECGLWCAGEAA